MHGTDHLRSPAAAAVRRKRRTAKSCEDCFFHQHMLCALELGEPCATFRESGPQGLIPPRQGTLLVRDAEPIAA